LVRTLVKNFKDNKFMKLLNWIKLICVIALPLAFASCKSGPTGNGTPMDNPEGTSQNEPGDVGGEGNIPGGGSPFGGGIAETTRPTLTPGGLEKIWSAIHFDYDSAAVKADDRSTLEEIATWSKANPDKKIVIEGNCDERGTREYNRALGQRRASAAREYLIKLGVAANSLSTISYGEEKPAEPAHDDSAWGKNRRDEFGIIK
jgi:peptidoglycan-associated lipoprotein